MKRSNNSSRREKISLSPISRMGWLSLILSLASETSAFDSSPRQPFAMLGSRSSLRDTSIDSYGRQNLPRKASTSTRLQYRDGSDDPTYVKPSFISSKWWNSLFSSESDTVSEQDNVDEYLEFLDRRYNRLHEEKEQKPFSAIDWLLQGHSSDPETLTSKQQKEDALYVLGVAGLASQKLLQKHPQLSSEHNNDDTITTTAVEATTMTIEALNALATSTDEVTFGHLFIKKVLVPFAKLLYFVHRRKQIFLNIQAERSREFTSKVARSTARIVLFGPKTLAKFILEVGGGKPNITSAVALASALVVLARPVFRAVVTEGSVGP
jgi:hypothetical protein